MRTRLVLFAIAASTAGCFLDFAPPRDGGMDASPAAMDDAASDGASDAGPPADVRANVIFVTSAAHAGTHGLLFYDQVCEWHARDAELDGRFVALLSTATEHAYRRLGNARGWVSTTGAPFADTIDELRAGQTFGPISDERGRAIRNVYAWTGSTTSLERSQSCSNWSRVDDLGTAGDGDRGAGRTFDAALLPCSTMLRIYCAQIDHRVEVAPTPIAGPARRLFVADKVWDASGGIADADAICREDARAHEVAGSFVALLADIGVTAMSRLTGPSVPWVRLDGALIWDPVAGPADASELLTTPSVSVSGQYIGGSGEWTGAPLPTTPGTAATTCDGWMVRAGSSRSEATVGAESHRHAAWFGHERRSCDAAARVYCIEQRSD